MKSTLAVLLVVVSLTGACRNDKNLKRGQQNYDVVQEGSATGVTSTISGPGETPPPATGTPLTGTNADTTTNFTLPSTQTDTTGGSMQPPGTIAGTMTAPIPSAAPTRPRAITSPSLRRTTTTETGTTMATDTVTVPPQMTTQTDTTATSMQAPTVDGRKKRRQQPPPVQPPPTTDTTDTAHPPH
jgi:hypothetical protein